LFVETYSWWKSLGEEPAGRCSRGGHGIEERRTGPDPEYARAVDAGRMVHGRQTPVSPNPGQVFGFRFQPVAVCVKPTDSMLVAMVMNRKSR